MERTQIYLSRAERRALDRLARETGHTRSQLIRMAIDQVYLKAKKPSLKRALEQSLGAWADRSFSGATYAERMRRGRLAALHGVSVAHDSDR